MTVSYDLDIDTGGNLPLGEIASLAAAAEAAGFGGLWKGETNNRDPLTLLAACAPSTGHIALGTGVVHMLARSPVAAGMAAATLNDLSGGRLILGIGVANATLGTWHGTSFAHPVSMARDYLTILRQTYSGQRVSHAGTQFTASGFRYGGTVPQTPLRILLAGLGPRMAQLAGEIADGVLINMATPDAVAEIAGWAKEGAAAAGRDPESLEIAIKVRVAVNADLAAANKALQPVIATYTRAAGYTGMLNRHGFAADLQRIDAAWSESGFGAAIRAVDDDMIRRMPTLAVRGVNEVPARLQPYIDAGATRILLPLVATSPDVDAETRAFIKGWAARS